MASPSPSVDHELEEYYLAAVSVARAAGKVALEGFTRDKVVATKTTQADLVTETDKRVEDLIRSSLQQQFPSHDFIGEESATNCELTDNLTWIVDPIDGTVNYIHQIPLSAVSIGLWKNKEPIVGVVYNFITDDLYAAKKGQGATLNGKPIHTSGCTDLSKVILIIEYGYDRLKENFEGKMQNVQNLYIGQEENVRGVRNFGCAALALCSVASGVADAYYDFGLHCWDMAAGVLIVQEAGGTVCSTDGGSLDILRREVLCASSQEVASKIVERITHRIEYKSDNQ